MPLHQRYDINLINDRREGNVADTIEEKSDDRNSSANSKDHNVRKINILKPD